MQEVIVTLGLQILLETIITQEAALLQVHILMVDLLVVLVDTIMVIKELETKVPLSLVVVQVNSLTMKVLALVVVVLTHTHYQSVLVETITTALV